MAAAGLMPLPTVQSAESILPPVGSWSQREDLSAENACPIFADLKLLIFREYGWKRS